MQQVGPSKNPHGGVADTESPLDLGGLDAIEWSPDGGLTTGGLRDRSPDRARCARGRASSTGRRSRKRRERSRGHPRPGAIAILWSDPQLVDSVADKDPKTHWTRASDQPNGGAYQGGGAPRTVSAPLVSRSSAPRIVASSRNPKNRYLTRPSASTTNVDGIPSSR